MSTSWGFLRLHLKKSLSQFIPLPVPLHALSAREKKLCTYYCIAGVDGGSIQLSASHEPLEEPGDCGHFLVHSWGWLGIVNDSSWWSPLPDSLVNISQAFFFPHSYTLHFKVKGFSSLDTEEAVLPTYRIKGTYISYLNSLDQFDFSFLHHFTVLRYLFLIYCPNFLVVIWKNRVECIYTILSGTRNQVVIFKFTVLHNTNKS